MYKYLKLWYADRRYIIFEYIGLLQQHILHSPYRMDACGLASKKAYTPQKALNSLKWPLYQC